MSKFEQMEKMYVYRLGFWSAIVATILVAIAGSTATASIQPLATLVGFLLTLSFLVVMACIHSYASDEKKVFSLAGLSFGIVYATLISVNYFIQLTIVRSGAFDLPIFDMTNTDSMMWVIEILGYFFLGLAMLSAAPVFGSSKVERLVKWLFALNGILGILTPLYYTYVFPIEVAFWGLIVWDVLTPIAAASLAYLFKQGESKTTQVQTDG